MDKQQKRDYIERSNHRLTPYGLRVVNSNDKYYTIINTLIIVMGIITISFIILFLGSNDKFKSEIVCGDMTCSEIPTCPASDCPDCTVICESEKCPDFPDDIEINIIGNLSRKN